MIVDSSDGCNIEVFSIPKPSDDIVPPGHRFINDYYGHYINNGKAADFILLGQWREFDLYAIKQHGTWSLGARWSDEGSEYMSSGYADSLEKIANYGMSGELGTDQAAIRLASHFAKIAVKVALAKPIKRR